MPADVASELAAATSTAIPGAEARVIVERQLRAPVTTLYAKFDETPLARPDCPGARQPHDGARWWSGAAAEIDQRIARDVDLLHALGELAALARTPTRSAAGCRRRSRDAVQRTGRSAGRQRQPAAAEFRQRRRSVCARDPLGLTAQRVLTLERVHGISSDDIAAIDAAGLDRKALAAKGVRVFYEQVFRDNFFHADAHPGNIWVDATRVAEPRFIALDFGIMGSLPEADQYWLAQNFIALFERDYARIATSCRCRLDASRCAHGRTRSGRAYRLRAVFHPLARSPGRTGGQAVPDRAPLRATLQPQRSCCKDLAEYRGRRSAAGSEIDIGGQHPVLKRIPRRARRIRGRNCGASRVAVHRAADTRLSRCLRQTALANDAAWRSAGLAMQRDEAQRTRRTLAFGLLGATLLLRRGTRHLRAAVRPLATAGHRYRGHRPFVTGWPRRGR